MTKPVRVRFAPSPTGPLHIGGIRTALFNYLFAKKHQGTFVLRIEDTDQNRYMNGTEQYIIEALNWCAIPFDEGPDKNELYGPYRQSERQHLYQNYATTLIEMGKAYYAFDTNAQLESHRKDHEANGKTFIYNWHNREKGRLVNSLVLSEEETQAKIKAGENYVIRFKSPQDQSLQLKDMIRGTIDVDTNILDDKIIFKSDGMPTYHLANIVDDHLMKISHVIRGEEWLPSLALHQLLYEAFNWEPPKFAHLPLILKPTGKGKLSKRDGDKLGFPVFPLAWTDPKTKIQTNGYKNMGYFPETVVNFLAFLGWNPGTEQEIFNINQLIDAFDISKVNKAGARFDPDKTKWYNHHYMQQQDDLVLARAFRSYHKNLENVDINYIALVVALVKERATFISDFWSLSHFFFETPKTYNPKAIKKAIKDDTKLLLTIIKPKIESIQDYTKTQLETTIKSWITSKGIGFGQLIMPLRLALVGDLKGPDVFDIMFMIGKHETLNRISKLIRAF